MSDRRKKPRMMDEAEEIITLRLLMNGKEAGTLIGKGGTTISTLRQSSDAIINISDNSTRERIVSVTGGLENVIKAFKLISRRLEENSFNNDTSSYTPVLVFQLVVPATQCGSLIGTGGSKIKTIRETSGAAVQIATDPLPMSSERMVTVSGKPEDVNVCVKAICEILIENPARGHIAPYYPQNYGRVSSSYNERSSERWSSRNSGDSSRRRKRSDDYDDYMSDTMPIPSQYAGSVIGKRGNKINEIRSKSGASIKIADEAEGSKERIVTIGGTPEAVGMAQFLIKTRLLITSIREHMRQKKKGASIEYEEKRENGEA